MSMRCVSKCFIGRPSKVYFVLFLGVIVGFALSTMIQNLDVATLQRTVKPRLEKVLDYRTLVEGEGRRVEFSNLDQQGEGEGDEYGGKIDIGDYDYERMMFSNEERARQQQQAHVRESEEKKEAMFDSAAVASPKVPEDVRQKQREYRRENWRGRNMRETDDGVPPKKLADELATRQTVLIAVITTVTQLMSQTLAIQGTWAPEATQVIYFVGEVQTMPHLPHGMVVIQLEGIDDKVGGWGVKEITVVKYLIDHYLDSVDWFLLVGDEVYVQPERLESTLNGFDASLSVYLGRSVEGGQLCATDPGVVYSRGMMERLKPYLPMCWPGQGEKESLRDCLSAMNVRCTLSAETVELFVSDAKQVVESPQLFSRRDLTKALVIHPVKYPKYMYRVHSFFKELEFNRSTEIAKSASSTIQDSHPFIPSYLRSSFKTTPTLTPPPPSPSTPPKGGGVVIRPRNVPKNKFEVNNWEYFNQTRLMTVMNESPARGIIGGIREEARYALTKAIYLANQGVPQNQRYVFDKLENGYHRVDPMRGSEFILDFVFRRQSDRGTKIRKRLSILRPFHETVVPVDSPELLPTVNFVVVLSGLSHRLEHFLMQYERNILQTGEDATLTVMLFDSPDASKVRRLIQQYVSRYDGAKMTVVDSPGEFARGVGLHRGVEQFRDEDLLFLVDVDLDISTDFLQRCRLNTILKKQVYFPIFFKLYNPDFVKKYHRGNSSMFITRHNGHWAHYSYGMVCVYASDYRRTGGFDVSMKGWGEEDVDLFNKVLGKGLEVFRAPDPGLIHNWHRKMCNKQTVTTTAAYEHCLQSKGENLADRIELAQYVFESELGKGNVL